MRPARLLWTAAALVSSITVTQAQTRVVRYADDRLAGITEVDVVVTTAGAPCASSRTGLQNGARERLRAAGLRATISERASSWHYTVFVNVDSAVAGEMCASAVMTEVVAQVEGFPEADKFAPDGAWGSILMGPMSLAREIDLVTTPPAKHDASVQEVARAQAAALAERIRRARP